MFPVGAGSARYAKSSPKSTRLSPLSAPLSAAAGVGGGRMYCLKLPAFAPCGYGVTC